MPQPDQEIRQLLEARLAAMPSVPTHNGKPQIAWENVAFDPQDGAMWLRATYAPAATDYPDILSSSSRVIETGLFLVDCFSPEGKGPAQADALAAAVRAHFRPGLPIAGANVRIVITGNSRTFGQQGAAAEPDFFVPVTIGWRASYSFT